MAEGTIILLWFVGFIGLLLLAGILPSEEEKAKRREAAMDKHLTLIQKPCRHCREIVHREATTCPYCRKEPGEWEEWELNWIAKYKMN